MPASPNLPISVTPPSAPSSPRQPSGSLSKIPRRRPSTQLATSTPSSRAPSSSAQAPGSHTKTALAGSRGHARKTSLSHAHFADEPLPEQPLPEGASLQDRRRRMSGEGHQQDRDETTELARRTPSLSICIPSTSSSPAPFSASAAHKHSLRRQSHPSRPSPTPSTSSPSQPFAPHSRRTSAAGTSRTPRSGVPCRPPMAERSWSNNTVHTYTSFDFVHPQTPKEEREQRELFKRQRREQRERERGWFARAFGPPLRDDEEEEVGERTALLGGNVEAGVERSGWRFVAAETWCYAKHILPPLLVFVGLVLLIGLLAYRQVVHRVVHPGPEE
ncbi:hypothetical protein JCM8547_002426 [Rhodosporidiobolus lusitaniae]